ncbi:MAG: hypothetical protein AUK47_23210 [Deltaproteobacteria bacterium CG2_30_63_29]|nr:MAG: hypothetical protein AUK47_23210 [Deltaproteobacteria bacterium CG2_30_63_29]PJB49084.1 MAG: hypothetical protein CO108_01025 [Deltaproteobacteria bacterium CG_4_9_14_3_um_filter_63_12]
MRFDKNIWSSTCLEYSAVTDKTQLDLSYFTTATKVLVSVWLELLQDHRAPITRQLHELSVVDLADELLRAMDLWSREPQTSYRVINLAERLKAGIERWGTGFPAHVEADRFMSACDLFVEFLSLSNKERDTKDGVWQRSRTALGFPAHLNGGNSKAQEVFALHVEASVVSLRAALEGDEAYLTALLDGVRAEVMSAATPDYTMRIELLVRELLAFALRRGFSREHLAELPIKSLRADNKRLKDKSLEERLSIMLGAFRGAKQRYEAFVALEGPVVEIDGEILPNGIALETWADWSSVVPTAEKDRFAQKQAFRLDIARLLEQDFVAEAFQPHDVFAARDIALTSVRRCLDVVFLLKGSVPRVFPHVLIVASGVEPYKKVLEVRRDFAPGQISLKFLRSVPAEWVDALHWFREGVEDPSDEVGIINLWTSLELLSRRSKREHSSDAERVQETVGRLAAIGILDTEMRYLDAATRFAIGAETHVEWPHWLSVTEADLESAFASFPHLGGLLAAPSTRTYGKERYREVCRLVRWILVWSYSCRNDIVHEGRRQLPGADILRDALAAVARAALTVTLRLESRNYASCLRDCFFWAENESKTIEALSTQDDLARLSQRFNQ